ncbi:MAG TPA: nucleotide pyrophosphatase/phosphodiesterase family protein [Nitrososphaeraceae archaeon]|nr:nucleotide pyrophosphatase/phosphodiesterase family protein [Nitrososphaeraceae archaeon]
MVRHIIILDIVGLESNHLNSNLIPNIAELANEGVTFKMEPVFPAVTCTVQASLLSGHYPNQHGIISNGLYDKANYAVSFWEQSNSLVQAERIWDIAKRQNNSSFKTAVLFGQNTMYSKSDIVITPKPLHMEDGIVMWCYSKPVGYYETLKRKYGEFNLATYWGPLASYKSSNWIIQAACDTLENERPNLMFTYIPHIDYSAQRFGKNSKEVREDLKRADELVGGVIQKTIDLGIKDDTQFVIFSEYGFSDVLYHIPLNRKLRDAGLLAVRTINDKEYIDFEFSKAFAMVDHQIAHVYIKDISAEQIKRVLKKIDGVDRVLSAEDMKTLKINHERTGDLIAVANKDTWFSYYWWYENEKAPNFARAVDIHRKPGYDPAELFIDQNTKSIPLNPNRIRASHGRPPNRATEEGLAVYVSNQKSDISRNSQGIVGCVDIGRYLINLVS